MYMVGVDKVFSDGQPYTVAVVCCCHSLQVWSGPQLWYVCDNGCQRYCFLFCWQIQSLISETAVRRTKRAIVSDQGGTEGGGSHHHYSKYKFGLGLSF
jgi:hypothetical protein